MRFSLCHARESHMQDVHLIDKQVIKIEVISDIVCPWCYIGKRRMEKAIELASNRLSVEVEYFPFELNPHMPPGGEDYRTYLIGKYGSEERFHELTDHIKIIAAREGLEYNLHLQQTYPNTRNMHRVIMIARDEGKQPQVVERFFKAYFTEGVDLTRIENLVRLSGEAGMDGEMIAQLLDSNVGVLEIEMAEKELHDLGITSVPLYIVENRWTISGAQSVEAFTRVFDQAAAMSNQVH